MVTPLPPPPPTWGDNADQDNLVKNVNMFYTDANSLSENNDRINGIMAEIDAFQQDGNFDAAMILVITALFPAIIDRTSWEQKTYIDRQSIGAAINVMGADHSEAAFEGGQSAVVGTTTDKTNPPQVVYYMGGMTDAQATTFQQDTYWLDYDLHAGPYTDAEGNKHDSMLSMIDDTTKNDIIGNLEGTMSQFKNADGSSCTPEQFAYLPINDPRDTGNTTYNTNLDHPTDANSIKFQVDGMWTPIDGNTGTPTGTIATQVLGLFQNTTNTCNAAEQSYNSWYQQWVTWENNFVGSTGEVIKSMSTQNTAFVNATRPS
jgi:hypothetical protein